MSGGEGVCLLFTWWAMSSVIVSLFSRLTLVDSCLLAGSGVQADLNELLLSEVKGYVVNCGCGFSSLCTGELWTSEIFGLLSLET